MDEHNKLPFNPALAELAQYLRDFSSNAEIVLWDQLKDNQLRCTFTWQHPIGDYVVTFFCEEKKLAVDIESDAHTHPDAYFSLVQKEVDLQQLDIRLLRLREEDVLKDVTGVTEKITKEINA